MPMTVNWYDDARTIIKVSVARDSSWNEYYDVINWIVKEIPQVEHRVEVIFIEEAGMPKGNPLPHIKWGSKQIIDLPNSGHTFIVSSNGNAFGQMIMTILAKVFMKSSAPMSDDSKRLFFVSDIETALAQINRERMERNLL